MGVIVQKLCSGARGMWRVACTPAANAIASILSVVSLLIALWQIRQAETLGDTAEKQGRQVIEQAEAAKVEAQAAKLAAEAQTKRLESITEYVSTRSVGHFPDNFSAILNLLREHDRYLSTKAEDASAGRVLVVTDHLLYGRISVPNSYAEYRRLLHSIADSHGPVCVACYGDALARRSSANQFQGLSTIGDVRKRLGLKFAAFLDSLESDPPGPELTAQMLGAPNGQGGRTGGLASNDAAPIADLLDWLVSYEKEGRSYFGGLSAMHLYPLNFTPSAPPEASLGFADRLPFYLWYAESGPSKKMVVSFESYSSIAIEASIETREPVLMQVHFDRLVAFLRSRSMVALADEVQEIANGVY